MVGGGLATNFRFLHKATHMIETKFARIVGNPFIEPRNFL